MKKYIAVGLCLLMMFATGCGKEKTLETGRYVSESDFSEEIPVITIDENNVFSLTYFSNFTLEPVEGTYTIEDNTLTLTGLDSSTYIFDIDDDNNIIYRAITPTELKMLTSDHSKIGNNVPDQTKFVLEKENE